MSRFLLANGTPVQMRNASIPLKEHADWSMALPVSLLAPSFARWVPQFEIELVLVFQCVEAGPPYTAGTRYLNPPQHQIGHWNEMYNGFVTNDGRIMYEQQAIRQIMPAIQLAGAHPNKQLNMRLINTGGYMQGRNNRGFTMCETKKQEQNAEYRGYRAETDELIMRIDYGAFELSAIAPPAGFPPLIELEGGVHWPSEYRGVIWPGWVGSVAWELAYYADGEIPGYEDNFVTNPATIPDIPAFCEGIPDDGGGPVVEVP